MGDEQEFIDRLLDPRTREKAFSQLISRYQRPLYSHIRGMVVSHDDADDVLQETFIKVYRHLHAFKGESKLFTWMYRIATNEAITHLQRRSRVAGFTTDEYQATMINNLRADILYDGDEMQLKLQMAVAALPEKQQLVFRLKYFEEMKYEDMSRMLGTSVGALKASYHHAVRKIEDYINKG